MTKPDFFFPRDYAAHERHCIEHADEFVVCDFRGRATYAKSYGHRTREAAERAALALIAQRETPSKRPVLLYAVCGVHQVVAGLVRP